MPVEPLGTGRGVGRRLALAAFPWRGAVGAPTSKRNWGGGVASCIAVSPRVHRAVSQCQQLPWTSLDLPPLTGVGVPAPGQGRGWWFVNLLSGVWKEKREQSELLLCGFFP